MSLEIQYNSLSKCRLLNIIIKSSKQKHIFVYIVFLIGLSQPFPSTNCDLTRCFNLGCICCHSYPLTLSSVFQYECANKSAVKVNVYLKHVFTDEVSLGDSARTPSEKMFTLINLSAKYGLSLVHTCRKVLAMYCP